MKRIAFLITLIASVLRLSAQVQVEASIDSIQIFVGEQVHVTLSATAKEQSKVEFPQFKPTEYITPGVEVLGAEELEAKILAIEGVQETLVSGDGATREIVANIYCEESCEEVVRHGVSELNKSLPVYMRISRVKTRFTPFPKTASGKIKLNPPDEIQTR